MNKQLYDFIHRTLTYYYSKEEIIRMSKENNWDIEFTNYILKQFKHNQNLYEYNPITRECV